MEIKNQGVKKCECCGRSLPICDCFGAGHNVVLWSDLQVKDLEVLESDGFSAEIDGDEKTVKIKFEG